MNLEEFYNENKKLIKAIYETGSRVNPYVKNNYHDTDLLFIPNEGKRAELFEQLKSINFTFDDIEKPACLCGRLVDSPAHSHAYQYHYAKLLYGEDIRNDSKDCILNTDANKARYFESIKNWYLTLSVGAASKKMWYYVLMGCYILYNNSYDLTNEQANNIQLAHDGNITEKSIEFIKNFCQC